MEKTQLLSLTTGILDTLPASSRSNVLVELSPRDALIKQMGEAVIEALRAENIPLQQDGWRVSALGKQNDVLMNVSFHDGIVTACERYDTRTRDGQVGQHSRVYGRPVKGSHVPMGIVANTSAKKDLERREPTLSFAPLGEAVSFHEQHILSRAELEEMGALAHMADASDLWWAARKASLQLVSVKFIQIGDQIFRIHLCEDKVNNSGLSLLVWSANGDPLNVDGSGKTVWGMNITNSLSHRPGGNWVHMGRSGS